MRTRSGSRRWLVKRDVPERRRSTSRWMSSSSSARPGGQPSTTQPRPGPWLSPKLVTVNSCPKVLPAIRSPLQVVGAEQEDAAATVLELEPRERQFGKRLLHAHVTVAHFDEQGAARLEVLRKSAQDAAHDVEPVSAGTQCEIGFVKVFRRQVLHLRVAHIRGIRNDEVVARGAERRVNVAEVQAQPVTDAVTGDVAPRYF